MAYGQTQLSALIHDSSVTSLLTQGTNGIIYDTVFPQIYPNTGDPGTQVGATDSTINYYRVSPVDVRTLPMQTTYSVNCRASNMAAAEEIQKAAKDVLNRHSNGSVIFGVQVLSTIPPADETDNYNAPLEVIARSKNL